MNSELVSQAKARIQSTPILVNMVSQRVKQLNAGQRPYVMPLSPEEDKMDIALREIAEGKLTYSHDTAAIEKDEESHAKWNF